MALLWLAFGGGTAALLPLIPAVATPFGLVRPGTPAALSVPPRATVPALDPAARNLQTLRRAVWSR